MREPRAAWLAFVLLGAAPAFPQAPSDSLYDLYFSSATPLYYRKALYRVLRDNPARKIPPPDSSYAAGLFSPPPAVSSAAVAARASTTPSNSTAFFLRAAYAFPNPSRHGAPVDFRLQAGLADSVDLQVTDAVGRRVFSAALGAPRTLDDGNGLGPQPTYDCIWNPGASGVYVYVFTARKAGRPSLRKSGRIAVVK